MGIGTRLPQYRLLKGNRCIFSVTIDELLSGKELISIAEQDSNAKTQHFRDLVFALLDCAAILLLFIPFYGQPDGNEIRMVSWFNLTQAPFYIKWSYFLIVIVTLLWGVAVLALQNWSNPFWVKHKNMVSILLSILGVVAFMISLEPYASFFAFVLLLIKGILLLKTPMTPNVSPM